MITAEARNEHPWYNYARVLSFNSVWNMVCGGRGLGKTFGAKKIAINKAIKHGEQFIYLRRYKPDITHAKEEFWNDIEHLWPEFDFRTNGWKAQMSPVAAREDKKRQWTNIGYFIPLSSAQSYKSVPFPLVTTIVYDEFILEKAGQQYLPDEATIFQNFYNTVDRYQDKTRVFFLANSVSIANPYFVKWKIKPDENTDEFKRYGQLRDGRYFLVAHFPDAAEFQQSVYQTAFGQWIEGTEYGEYAVGNDFADNHDALIERKDPDAKYAFSLHTTSGKFAVWWNSRTDKFYTRGVQPRGTLFWYTNDVRYVTEDVSYLARSDRPLEMLRRAFHRGMVFFDEPSTRQSMLDVFKH